MIQMGPSITICDTCLHRSLDVLLRHASAGTRLVVDGSTQRGHFVIRVPVEIDGRNGATIDAGGTGTAVRIEAANVVIDGFTFRGSSGPDQSGDQAAIVATGERARIEHNRFIDNTFSVSLVRARGSLVARNRFDSSLGASASGDAIRIFASDHVTVAYNTVRGTRDVIVFFSDYATLVGNRVSDARYGLHDMYSNHLLARGNVIEHCEIGSNFMYARFVRIVGNVFAHNRGAAGYGVALENVDNALIRGNGFFDNHIGLQIVQSPSDALAHNVVVGNRFDEDGTALAAEATIARTTVVGNDFGGNLEQVRIDGGPSFLGITWDERGRGNHWDDYAGYDLNGDGIGDIAYAPRDPYETLSDANPEDQWFRYSPAAFVLDFAARAVPIVDPPAKLVDRAPLMSSPAIAIQPPQQLGSRGMLVECALGSAVLAGLPFAGLTLGARIRSQLQPSQADVPAIVVSKLTKRYGSRDALRDVTFMVEAGQALALWGPNGAGKTTVIRALLGEIWFEGSVSIRGLHPTPTSAAARSLIGYAPQHLPSIESSARDLAVLVAKLRGLPGAAADAAMARARITKFAKTAVGALSQGTQQRLAVALALLGDPPILVLDEPSASLDRGARAALIELLAAEKERGKTIVFASHLMEDVRSIADRVLVIEDSQVVTVQSIATFVAMRDGS